MEELFYKLYFLTLIYLTLLKPRHFSRISILRIITNTKSQIALDF